MRGYPEAILRPDAELIDTRRIPPDPDLADYLDYLWRVRWRVPGRHEQQVIPQPRIHLAAEDGRLLVHGILRGRFTQVLAGAGHVVGASFVPGGFAAFLNGPVEELADRVVPAAELLGVDDRPYAAKILQTGRDWDDPDCDSAMAATMQDYLRAVGPLPDPRAAQIAALVRDAEDDHRLTRADELAQRAGVSLRTLQREFGRYVGIGPKWVIQRFRLLDAAAAALGGTDVDWARLAVELGFTDQAHLVRRFTEVIGTPPAAYARELASRFSRP